MRIGAPWHEERGTMRVVRGASYTSFAPPRPNVGFRGMPRTIVGSTLLPRIIRDPGPTTKSQIIVG